MQSINNDYNIYRSNDNDFRRYLGRSGKAEKWKERIQRNKERRKSEDGTELEKNVSEERIKEKYEIQ